MDKIAELVIAEYRDTGRLPLRIQGAEKLLYPGLQGLGYSRYALYYPNDRGVHVVEVFTLSVVNGETEAAVHSYASSHNLPQAISNAVRNTANPLLENERKKRWLHKYLSSLSRIKINELIQDLPKIDIVISNTDIMNIPQLFRRVK